MTMLNFIYMFSTCYSRKFEMKKKIYASCVFINKMPVYTVCTQTCQNHNHLLRTCKACRIVMITF